jgi:hypothetical protein
MTLPQTDSFSPQLVQRSFDMIKPSRLCKLFSVSRLLGECLISRFAILSFEHRPPRIQNKIRGPSRLFAVYALGMGQGASATQTMH